MAEEFENLELRDENTGETETFTPVDTTARQQIEELNETLTEQIDKSVEAMFKTEQTTASGIDLNDIKTPGLYPYLISYTGASNGPSLSSSFYMIVFKYGDEREANPNNGSCTQIAIAYRANEIAMRYYRGDSDTWSDWVRVI